MNPPQAIPQVTEASPKLETFIDKFNGLSNAYSSSVLTNIPELGAVIIIPVWRIPADVPGHLLGVRGNAQTFDEIMQRVTAVQKALVEQMRRLDNVFAEGRQLWFNLRQQIDVKLDQLQKITNTEVPSSEQATPPSDDGPK